MSAGWKKRVKGGIFCGGPQNIEFGTPDLDPNSTELLCEPKEDLLIMEQVVMLCLIGVNYLVLSLPSHIPIKKRKFHCLRYCACMSC